MRTEPMFVKPSDYFNYHGVDLDAELELNDNESNKSNIFLMKIEDKLLARMDNIACRVRNFDRISEFQKECIQKAILIQAEYIIRNGDLFTDSGYDMEKGKIIDVTDLKEIQICPTAYEYLMNSGIWSRVLINRRRVFDFR